ncbi:helix-turn-helix domain-containing protein [Bacillus cereus]|uniref:helix-turn-helix domain-containing protein n=1 Tax=Bacillus cereus TaxID=1396 RepID=UPI0015CF565C|nr:helix-turn-helix transcriptional regulator [Bacillus cereus]
MAILLTERNLKITKVANDTGISRTTLTSLSKNDSQGIQFETINKLCTYLKISPTDFFTYIPMNFDISIYIDTNSGEFVFNKTFELFLNLYEPMKEKKSYSFIAKLVGIHNNVACEDVEIIEHVTGGKVDFIFHDIYIYPDNVSEQKSIKEAFNKIPTPFLADIEKQAKLAITDEVQKIDDGKLLSEFHFDWFGESDKVLKEK